ncbi:GNAT family N-acetyltransferase [Candidatus Odyssella thessalonicensis]|uniref:GNAT family N-acetyltransferase n=1 Tax=Candidatus Odyssella thessalonicensis TaxID=84647 RepID=UPI000225B72A|nr:GNAT family N-acetyltransferase [Candidatus Odyssella thessalonicensis]
MQHVSRLSALLMLFMAGSTQAMEQATAPAAAKPATPLVNLATNEQVIDDFMFPSQEQGEHDLRIDKHIFLEGEAQGYLWAKRLINPIFGRYADLNGRFLLVAPKDAMNSDLGDIFVPKTYISFLNFHINYFWDNAQLAQVATIDYIETNARFRNKGYATSMVKHFIKIMQQNKIKFIVSSARVDTSVRVFQKNGFIEEHNEAKLPVKTGESYNHYLQLDK